MRARRLLPLACLAALIAAGPLRADEEADAIHREAAKAEAKKDDEILATLKTRKVTVNFADTPAYDILDFMRDITGLNIVTTPGFDPDAGATLQVRDIALDAGLKLMFAPLGLVHEVKFGLIWVRPKDVALADRVDVDGVDAATAKALDKKVTLNFDDTPLSEVAAFLKDITGRKVAVTGDAGKAEIQLRIRDVPLRSVLRAIAAQAGGKFVGEGAEIAFEPDPAPEEKGD